MEYKNKERAENITIYLVNVLSKIEKGPIEDMNTISEKEPLDEKYKEIFDKLSNAVAKLLDEKLIDDEVVINSTIPTERVSTEEAYCNYIRIDNATDNILSKAFKDGYAFVMIFGSNSRYGMDTYETDTFIAVKDEDIYGPIYICASNSPDLRHEKERDEKAAKELINRILKV